MKDSQVVLEKVLQNIIENEQMKNPTTKIESVGTDGASFTSALFRITISDSNHDVLNLFAKVAVIGPEFRIALNADYIFRAERFFYEELAESYKKILEKNNVPREEHIIFPKFYACNTNHLEETFVLENLQTKGYILYNKFKPVDWKYAAKAIEELAKFHALSFAYKIENPEKFESLHKYLINIYMHKMSDLSLGMIEKMKIMALAGTEEQYKDRFKKFLDSLDVNHLNKPQRQPLLVHGDYRSSNLMVKYNGNNIEALVPIDFQAIYIGSPINDLLYFIICGTDEQFRRENFQNLVDHYYESLQKSMKLLNLECSELYPREDFDADLKERLIYGLWVAILSLPAVCIGTDAPTLAEGMSDFIMVPNDMLKERLNGVLRDYIKWGLL